MIQKQITGLGPKEADGSMKIFTYEPQPFIASASWLTEQTVTPVVGDYLDFDAQGKVMLLAEPYVSSLRAATRAADNGLKVNVNSEPTITLSTAVRNDFSKQVPEDAEPLQKKTDGSEGSGAGSKPSQHKYRALPVEVDAYEIVSVAADKNVDGSLNLALSNGTNVAAEPDMLARITPKEGDYWVIQSDGYVYLNPGEVFTRKYAPITD